MKWQQPKPRSDLEGLEDIENEEEKSFFLLLFCNASFKPFGHMTEILKNIYIYQYRLYGKQSNLKKKNRDTLR